MEMTIGKIIFYKDNEQGERVTAYSTEEIIPMELPSRHFNPLIKDDYTMEFPHPEIRGLPEMRLDYKNARGREYMM